MSTDKIGWGYGSRQE